MYAIRSYYVHVEQAYQLEAADHYDASDEAVERALNLHPWYRPAVQQKAKLLTLRGEDDAAYSYLYEAAGKLESEGVLAQLYSVQMEHRITSYNVCYTKLLRR